MKRAFLAALFLLGFFSVAFADQFVDGHIRSDGTYVAPHYRSSPDRTPTNNYNFEGNVNPYTGQQGHDHYRDNPRSPYYDRTPRMPRSRY